MNSSDSSSDSSGNTISESHAQIAPAVRWCFTLNNYTDDDIKEINSAVSSNSSKYLIFSEEHKHEGTPHLQGYIEFKKKLRPDSLKWNKKIHWEKSKGTKIQNITYCQKEGDNCYINGKLQFKMKILEETQLYDWEKEIIDMLKHDPDDRKIYWYWEETGGIGKSAFTKYLCVKYDAICVSGKFQDIACLISNIHETNGTWPQIIIVDIPRSFDKEYLNFAGFESIKNGCFFSGKYTPVQVLMPIPHMIFFSNTYPVTEEMSKDRWVIKNLREAPAAPDSAPL